MGRWGEIGKAVAKAGLPGLGGALGGPLGGIVGAVVAKTLGAHDASPEAVQEALAANPDAYIRLREIEAQIAADANATEIRAAEIETADRQSARSFRGDDRMRVVLACVLVPAPIIVLISMATGVLTMSAADVATVSTILGFMLSEAKAATGFYFGTSVGSAKKQVTIDAMATGGE